MTSIIHSPAILVRRLTIAVALVAGAIVVMRVTEAGARAAASVPFTFADATAAAGLAFTHENGAAGAYWYPELFGGGVAVLDADGDRWPDLLFVNGRSWKPGSSARAAHALYRNNHDATFSNITAGSGFDTLDVYGLGATVGDFDNDGRDDVFVTTTEGGRLLRSLGAGKFADVTTRAGIRNSTFAVSAAWFDYDQDGLLDLFIGNYVEWSPAIEAQVRCTQGGVRGYCGPDAYKPVAPKLYRNLGGGRFEDATLRAGLGDPSDKVMGVAVLDYNGDGWLDLFVGSDRVPAKLYRNDGRGRFVDEAVRAGVALSENGVARANMGADAADYDRSGRPHLVVGNFLNEMLGLYHNENGALFRDVAPRSDVGRASLLSVTWATFFLDADLDGFLDIFAANGGTDESQGRDARARISQPPLLLRNRGNGTFENITQALGQAFTRPVMGRGAAYLDFDGDGDLDLVMTTLDGAAVLFRNDGANRNRWLRVRLAGTTSNHSAVGAVVRVTSPSGTQWQMVHSGSSYASQSELPLTFGLGADATVSKVEVVWPSRHTQTVSNPAPNQLLSLVEGQ
ncbi:MAG TPA: CRTAC1 family protein [Vicinamibacterales bacterium]|nr:CRTAC1 family protein [Vicinamibacterales bacterium]